MLHHYKIPLGTSLDPEQSEGISLDNSTNDHSSNNSRSESVARSPSSMHFGSSILSWGSPSTKLAVPSGKSTQLQRLNSRTLFRAESIDVAAHDDLEHIEEREEEDEKEEQKKSIV